jgi:hypothetical protein
MLDIRILVGQIIHWASSKLLLPYKIKNVSEDLNYIAPVETKTELYLHIL